jgi:hypothetical protein
MQKPHFRLTSLMCGALAICALAAPARAQEPTSPPPASAPPPSSGPVVAGGAIGVGAMTSFAPDPRGADALLVYDQPMFHLDLALGYLHISHNNNNTAESQFRFGLGGWYHLARGSMADFSVGGTVGMSYNSPVGPGTSYTGFSIEPGAEARVFLSPNLALMGRVGFAIDVRDNNHDSDFAIGGSTIADFGFTYFFR